MSFKPIQKTHLSLIEFHHLFIKILCLIYLLIFSSTSVTAGSISPSPAQGFEGDIIELTTYFDPGDFSPTNLDDEQFCIDQDLGPGATWVLYWGIETFDGSATYGSEADYQIEGFSTGYADGGWACQYGESPVQWSSNFNLILYDDALPESTETATFTTFESGSETLIGSTNITIYDDDEPSNPGVLNFESDWGTTEANTDISLLVTRSSGTDGEVCVNYHSEDGTAWSGSDYEQVSSTLCFPDGEVNRYISLDIYEDSEFEGDETFDVVISSPTGGASIGDDRITFTIHDDDSWDLAITSAVMENNAEVDVGGEIRFYVDVSNLGEVTSPPRDLAVGIYDYGELYSFPIGAISPGATVPYSIAGIVPEIEPGSWEAGPCVLLDGGSAQDANGENDCVVFSIQVMGLDQPDLQITSISASVSSVEQDGVFGASVTVHNAGDEDASATTVGFYLSDNRSITGQDIFLNSYSVSALLAGRSVGVAPQLTASAPAGSYYLGACVDPVPNESDESNNCNSTASQITVEGGVGGGCSSVSIGCGYSGSANLGASECTSGPLGPGHYAELYRFSGEAGDTLILSAEWGFDGYLVLEDPNGLVVAQNDNYTSSSNSRLQHQLASNGTYSIWATSYAPDTMGSFNLSVECGNPGGPDLEPDQPSVSDTTPLPGQVLTVDARLRNVGNQASDSTQLHYLLSSDGTIDGTDTAFGADGAPGLAAGSSTFGSMGLSAPGTPGDYWIGVCADAVSDELSTANNCSAGRKITVARPIACTSSSMSCSSGRAGTLNSNDCTTGPRGAGYFAQQYRINAQAGVPLAVTSQWGSLDGYLYLTDPEGRIVAQNDDDPNTGPSQSLLEFIPASSGTYSLWPTTYTRNQQGNFDLSVECGTSAAPDLVTTATVVSDGSVQVGDSLTISYTVRNEGNATANSTQILMCLSNDPQISLRDSLLDTDQVSSLAAGESVTMDMVVTMPNEPGSYWVGPCAQVVAGETVTGNNCVLPTAATQRESAGGSRLQSSDGGGTLIVVSSGAACNATTLSYGQNRNGTLAASDCDRGPRGAGYLSDAYTFNGTAGDTVSLQVDWSGVDGYLYLVDPNGLVVSQNDDSDGSGQSRLEFVLERTGTYTVWPSAFDQGQGQGLQQQQQGQQPQAGDPTGSYQLTLTGNNPSAPDLVVATPNLSDTTVRPGQSLAIDTTVRNSGQSTAAASKLRYYLAASQVLTEDDRKLGASDVAALTSSASAKQELTVPLNVTPGSYYITTCVDVDPLELNIGNNCAVNGPLQVEENLEPIAINTGLNDAWFNPLTDGQGFFINVFPDTKQMFMSWFTYDLERPPADVTAQLGGPGNRWLTALGTYERGVATLTVSLTSGGVFDSEVPAPAVDPTPYGTMTVAFSDCDHGEVTFDLTAVGESGSIPITRINKDGVPGCEDQVGTLASTASNGLEEDSSLMSDHDRSKTKAKDRSRTEAEGDAESAFNYSTALNDAWFNPLTNGQGFFFNVFPKAGLVFLSWFTYEVERPAGDVPYILGEPGHRWLNALGPFSGDRAELTLYETVGGVFNEQNPVPQNKAIGTITAKFNNCNDGEVEYDIDTLGLNDTVPITRITRDLIPGCEQKSKEPSDDNPEALTPKDKQVLENACNGEVNWSFDWPDNPDTDTYVFVLLRNDTELDRKQTYKAEFLSSSQSNYKKTAAIPDAHLEGWKWIYAPYYPPSNDGSAKANPFANLSKLLEGRAEHEFSVKPQSDPCLD